MHSRKVKGIPVNQNICDRNFLDFIFLTHRLLFVGASLKSYINKGNGTETSVWNI